MNHECRLITSHQRMPPVGLLGMAATGPRNHIASEKLAVWIFSLHNWAPVPRGPVSQTGPKGKCRAGGFFVLTIYGYMRVSTDKQAASGLSLDVQRERIRDHAKQLAKRKKLSIGKVYSDDGVSGSKRGLIYRPAGARLDAILQSGDHVVIVKLDRAFRSTLDGVMTCERWMERGVTIHFLDLGVDTATPIGRMLVSILATVAQWEAERIGERNRECKALLKSRGLSTNGVRRLGYSLGRDGKLRPLPSERRIAARVKSLRKKKFIWRQIAELLNRAKAKRPNGGKWTSQACWRLFHAIEKRWP